MKESVERTKEKYGDQRHLLLLDNNVLASKRFPDIIREIKEIGFTKGSKYSEPNLLELSIRNLKSGLNDRAYIKKIYQLLDYLLSKTKGAEKKELYKRLNEYSMFTLETATKENILKIYPYISDLYEKYRNKQAKNRYVDFNQGVDARFITEEKMKLLSEIPIRPLRIAFDTLEVREQYERAVRWASRYGIKNLSNYLLFNFEDEPIDLYHRLAINVGLCEELDISVQRHSNLPAGVN